MYNIADKKPETEMKVIVYHKGWPRESSLPSMKWSAENPFKQAYRYKTAFSGYKWMIEFPYSGVPYVADDVKYWTDLPEIPEEYR